MRTNIKPTKEQVRQARADLWRWFRTDRVARKAAENAEHWGSGSRIQEAAQACYDCMHDPYDVRNNPDDWVWRYVGKRGEKRLPSHVKPEARARHQGEVAAIQEAVRRARAVGEEKLLAAMAA